jgi:hypothetical protein
MLDVGVTPVRVATSVGEFELVVLVVKSRTRRVVAAAANNLESFAVELARLHG